MGNDRQVLIGELGSAMQAYQRSTQAFDDEVGRHLALNPTDLRCLDWLVDQPRSATELSEAVGVSSAAATAMIDRLEDKGFVRRSRTAEDRRKVMVEMTESGRERVGVFYGPLVMEGVTILDQLDDAELTVMLHHLHVIRDLTDRHRQRLHAQRAAG